jgi:hypothetical protein
LFPVESFVIRLHEQRGGKFRFGIGFGFHQSATRLAEPIGGTEGSAVESKNLSTPRIAKLSHLVGPPSQEIEFFIPSDWHPTSRKGEKKEQETLVSR